MKELIFTSVTAENSAIFHDLMQLYAKELDEHQGRDTDPELLKRWTDSIIEKQQDAARCLKLCCVGAAVVGFLYGKLDRSEDKGFKKVGYGYIMEFYVLPEYRRNGFGRQMLSHLEQYFKACGAKRIYLTADPVTGKPFWESMGFVPTGEINPENHQQVYERSVDPNFT